MASPLLSTSQMRAIQKTALLGMQSDILIQRRVTSGQSEFGDDKTEYRTVGTVKGWLYSTPTPEPTLAAGKLITVNTYRLWVPVGTDILPGDRVTIAGSEFNVSDTTTESTWQEFLNVSLRRNE